MCAARNLLNVTRMIARCAFVLAFAAIGCGSSSPPGSASGSDAGTTGDDAGGGDDASPTTPSATWTSGAETPNAMARWGMPMAYVASQQRFYTFGGNGGQAMAETWSFNPADTKWTKLAANNEPAPRYCNCVAALPEQNQLMLIGGRDDNGPLANGAWTLDLTTNAWTAVTGTLPGGVIGCMATYMENIKRVVVFGGGDALGVSSLTWAYDPVARTFAKLDPQTSPPARMDGMAAYDPGDGGRMLMFAGEFGINATTSDLWAFNGTEWSKLTPAGATPSKRRVGAHAFDAKRRTWFLFGGTIDSSDLKDVWTFDAATTTWTQLPDDTAPKARGFTSAGYDPTSDTYFVFGGLEQPSDVALRDGWQVKLGI
jgi:N-acetylneuraminic acid mutarotase